MVPGPVGEKRTSGIGTPLGEDVSEESRSPPILAPAVAKTKAPGAMPMNLVITNGIVDRIASGETDGTTIELTINGSYELSYNSLRIGPAVRLSYFRSEIDGFDESGAQGLNLSFQDQHAMSFQSALGVGATYAVSTSFGVLTLQGYSEWIHEYDDDSRTITLRYTNDPFADSPAIILTTDAPDRNRFGLGAGAALLLPGGTTTFISFDTVVGHSDYSNYAINIGLRLVL